MLTDNISEVVQSTEALEKYREPLLAMQEQLIALSGDKTALLDHVRAHRAGLITHALKTCSFYAERYGDNPAEAIKKLRPLRKRDLQADELNIWSDAFAGEPFHHWMTSGSTGEPTKFIVDEFSALSRDVSFWFIQHLAGNRDLKAEAGKTLMLRISSGEGMGGWYKKMPVYNNALLYKMSVFRHPRCDIQQVFDFVHRDQPLLLGGDPQAFLSFIEFWHEHFPNEKKYPYPVKNLTCGGNQLSAEARAMMEDFFNVTVTDCYGLSEVSMVASQCTHGTMHIHAPVNYVEIVDEDGNILPEGKTGNIVVTNFLNWAFPFIRYQTGDVGALDTKTVCPCGSVLPILKNFEGRKRRMFKRPNGELFSPNAMVGLFITLDLYQYQLIQETVEDYRFRYTPKAEFGEAQQEQVRAELEKCVGAPVRITFEEAENLVEPGVKFQDFISHCHQNPV